MNMEQVLIVMDNTMQLVDIFEEDSYISYKLLSSFNPVLYILYKCGYWNVDTDEIDYLDGSAVNNTFSLFENFAVKPDQIYMKVTKLKITNLKGFLALLAAAYQGAKALLNFIDFYSSMGEVYTERSEKRKKRKVTKKEDKKEDRKEDEEKKEEDKKAKKNK